MIAAAVRQWTREQAAGGKHQGRKNRNRMPDSIWAKFQKKRPDYNRKRGRYRQGAANTTAATTKSRPTPPSHVGPRYTQKTQQQHSSHPLITALGTGRCGRRSAAQTLRMMLLTALIFTTISSVFQTIESYSAGEDNAKLHMGMACLKIFTVALVSAPSMNWKLGK